MTPRGSPQQTPVTVEVGCSWHRRWHLPEPFSYQQSHHPNDAPGMERSRETQADASKLWGISPAALAKPRRCSFLEKSPAIAFVNLFSSGFLLEHFRVCLTHCGLLANNISKTFCCNFECRNN